MEIRSNILIGGRKISELSIDEQEKYKKKATDAQRINVESRLKIMISERRSEKEILEYLGLN